MLLFRLANISYRWTVLAENIALYALFHTWSLHDEKTCNLNNDKLKSQKVW